MRISDIINEDCVEVGSEICERDEALTRLLRLHQNQGNIADSGIINRELLRQEDGCPTAVSCRIAIPVIRDSGSVRTRLTAITIPGGVDYGAPDGRKVRMIFLITGREDDDDWLWLKARLSAAKSGAEFVGLLNERERARFAPVEPKKEYDCSKFLIKNKRKRESLFNRVCHLIPEQLNRKELRHDKKAHRTKKH